MLYDVIIIGGGPAGAAAAVYSARKRLKTLLIAESFGGQSVVSDDIQNWIGEAHISGFDLAQKLEAHVRAFSDVIDIKIGERAAEIKSTRANADNFVSKIKSVGFLNNDEWISSVAPPGSAAGIASSGAEFVSPTGAATSVSGKAASGAAILFSEIVLEGSLIRGATKKYTAATTPAIITIVRIHLKSTLPFFVF